MFYKHYKGGIYHTLGFTLAVEGAYYVEGVPYISAKHTETGRDVRVYMYNKRFNVLNKMNDNLVLYIDNSGQYWVRPKEAFFGLVEVDGETKQRFKLM